MSKVMENILSRRSIRRYTDEIISEEILTQIAKAGVYAPNAGSGQRAMMVVCTNSTINETLGKLNQQVMLEDFKGRLNKSNLYVSQEQPSSLDDPSIKDGFYGAKAIIYLFAPGNFLYSREDCIMMAENMMLAANDFGVGSCYIARAEKTFATDYGKEIMRKWGIPEGYMAYGNVILGYPQPWSGKVKARREGRIIFCREGEM